MDIFSGRQAIETIMQKSLMLVVHLLRGSDKFITIHPGVLDPGSRIAGYGTGLQ
jgi:hypothetical protein